MRALIAAHHAAITLSAGMLGSILSANLALAQELCGRPTEQPQALFDRLTKAEKLKEDFRDKSYVAISDKGKDTIWTFTMPGHPAHPSVVCRRPVPDGAETECQKLVAALQELNQRMLRDMGKQQKQ